MTAKATLLPETGWPKGWWTSDKLYDCCCGCGGRIKKGQRVYLTGKHGEMYADGHAPAEATHAGPLEGDTRC